MLAKLFKRETRPINGGSAGNRVVIIGTGAVGASSAFALLVQGIAEEIVLVDVNKEKCEGEACDMEHGISFVPEVKVRAGEYKDCAEAKVVIISAGIAQKPGQTRLELAEINGKIITEIVKEVVKYTKSAVILMVTNPLDVLTYTALKASGLPRNLVFGTGTTLDSSRFRYFIAHHFGLATESIGAYLIGEHGDSSVPVYSHCNAMGEPLSALPGYSERKIQEAYEKSRDAAGYIIKKKGFTCYGIALGVARIVRAILFDENHIFPLSVYLTGQYGLEDLCLSVPAVVGKEGIKQIIEIELSLEEKNQLQKSAAIIRENLSKVKAR